MAKAEGVLECLRDGDVNVDEFVGIPEKNVPDTVSPPVAIKAQSITSKVRR